MPSKGMSMLRIVCALMTALCLLGTEAFAVQPKAIGYPRLMQGAMIGAVHPDRVLIWARVSGPFRVRAELARDRGFDDIVAAVERRASKADDYCLTLPVTGLDPDTSYYYRVLVEDKVDRYWRDRPFPSLKTAPEGPARFSLAMGSCARFSLDRVQPIWTAMADRSPDLFFWLGDNIYGDALDADILAEEYRRQRDLESYQPVMHTIPQLAVWDDHDFGINDWDKSHPTKADALEVFKQYWANGSYGTSSTPGTFFTYSYGGVDFFMLDGRYHRDRNSVPDGPNKTMLGEGQLEWLLEGLRGSSAAFKVLVCGSGWTLQKGPEGDSWSAFRTERDALFATIMRERISGVVLISGDTHMSELNVIRLGDADGYDLYELVSSPLAQRPSGRNRALSGNEERVYPAYRLSPNFGLVEFDMTVPDPVLRYNLVDVWNRDVWEPFELRASQLRAP